MKIIGIFGTFIGYSGLLLQAITRSGTLGAKACHTAYKMGSENPILLTSYAVTLMKNGSFELARQISSKALAGTRHWSSIKTIKGNLAVCEWKLDNVDGAIDIYLSIMEEYGDKNQAYFQERATLPEIELLVSENPMMMVHDYVSLGFFHLVKGDLETAEYFTHAALHLHPTSGSAYDNLGQISLVKKDFESAREQFNTALQYNPQLPDSLYYLGTLYEADGNLVDALDYYE
jgi:tetratricopeptide (TPR) repeat protein